MHGHPRDAGWVMSHYRSPQRAGDAQLDLDLREEPPTVPAPRPAPEGDEAPAHSVQ